MEVVEDDGVGVNIKMVQEVVNKGGEVCRKFVVAPISILFHIFRRCLSDHICQMFQIRFAPYICVILGGGGIGVEGVGTL